MTDTRRPAPGVPLNYYQPDGGKIHTMTGEDGHLHRAICPRCHNESVYALSVMQLRPVSLAGMALKFGGEEGIQLVCRTPDCDLPDSPVVTPSRHRSYEQ